MGPCSECGVIGCCPGLHRLLDRVVFPPPKPEH